MIGLSLGRVVALMARYWYVLKGSIPRLLDIAYWPTVQMVVWGFMSVYLREQSGLISGAFGILLAVLVAWRVAVRLANGAPPLPAEMKSPERLAAHAGHLLLYALLVALPILGFLLTWYRGDALSFFGLFAIPSPVTPDRAIARSIKGLHSLYANGILIVAGLHALAALWHHFIRRDAVLRRMLPYGQS